MDYKITGYSTALFSTWYFIEELGLLFDAGDGLTSYLLQKAGKINHVFISHADRDHITGLLQLNQLNARPDTPVIYYPKDSSSFPALEAFSKQFDPHVKAVRWIGLNENDTVKVKDDIQVETMRNSHVRAEKHIIRSLSYKVYQTKNKLRPEYAGLSQEEIAARVREIGRQALSVTVKTNIVAYSGDTPVDDYERWDNSGTLIHEATFLGGPEDGLISKHGNAHSRLDEVLRMVSEIKVDRLILGHFSSRYSHEQIDDRIRALCKAYKIKIPVYRVLPGRVHKHILQGNPIN